MMVARGTVREALDVAARRITWGRFTNAGQTCIAPDYVLVERAAHDRLLDELTAVVDEFYDPLGKLVKIFTGDK